MSAETTPARPAFVRNALPRPLAARLSSQEMLVAQTLAETLREEQAAPKAQIARLVAILGAAMTQAVAEAAQRLFAGPGMLTKDGKRQRTLGGIFSAWRMTRRRQNNECVFNPSRASFPSPSARSANPLLSSQSHRLHLLCLPIWRSLLRRPPPGRLKKEDQPCPLCSK